MKSLVLILSLLLPASAFAATQVSTITKAELAKEVAHCYVAHERFKSEMYKTGKAEVYKELVATLAGDENKNKVINNAWQWQANSSASGSILTSKKAGMKYCSAIEEKLAALK